MVKRPNLTNPEWRPFKNKKHLEKTGKFGKKVLAKFGVSVIIGDV
jgi:hypothetical protein